MSPDHPSIQPLQGNTKQLKHKKAVSLNLAYYLDKVSITDSIDETLYALRSKLSKHSRMKFIKNGFELLN